MTNPYQGYAPQQAGAQPQYALFPPAPAAYGTPSQYAHRPESLDLSLHKVCNERLERFQQGYNRLLNENQTLKRKCADVEAIERENQKLKEENARLNELLRTNREEPSRSLPFSFKESDKDLKNHGQPHQTKPDQKEAKKELKSALTDSEDDLPEIPHIEVPDELSAESPSNHEPKKNSTEFPNGSQYEGPIVDGYPHGKGILKLPDGSVYEGNFQYGWYHGKGIYKHADGTVYEGSFAQGKAKGKGKWTHGNQVYEGQFNDDEFEGHGKFTDENGDEYEGEFYKGKPHGKGSFTAKSGESYEGQFKADKYHGQGTLSIPVGDKNEGQFDMYQGEFKDGRIVSGEWLTFLGDRYKGSFVEGKLHGAVNVAKRGEKPKTVYFYEGKEVSEAVFFHRITNDS